MEQNDPQVSDGFRSTFSSGGGFAPIGKVTRHLIVDFPAGRTEAWTMRRRDPAGHRGLYVTVTFGPGIGGSTTAGGGPEPESLDGPGAFPLQLAMSSSGSTGFQSLTGRAGSSVDKVSALYADGEGEVATGGGFWFLVPEPGRGAPLALIARDREGRELGRLAGARFQQVVSGRRQSLGRDPLGSIPKLVVPPRGEGVVVPSVARWSFRAPNVSVAEAKRLITAVGLVPKVRSTDASALSAPDVVVGQDPDGGSSMPAGGTVLLDVTAPAVQAPASLLVGVRRAANISSTTDQPVDGLRIGIVDFSTRPTSGWIMNRVQDRTPKGAVFSGARYVISADAPAESVVLWKPGKEQQAATIARRLGITKGATTEGLPRDLLATPEDSNADPAKPTYDVLVVLGTAPLKKPTGQGAVAP